MLTSKEELFLTTKQEPLKLKIALECFFTAESAVWKERYGAYLKKRLRPALNALIMANEIEKLEFLTEAGWLDSSALDAAIRMASAEQRTEILVYLMNVKNTHYGFHGKEYLLP